jgi:hypothetical protein
LHLQRPIEAESLELKFSGKETCSWEETSSDVNPRAFLVNPSENPGAFASAYADSDDSTIHHRGKFRIVTQIFPVFVFRGSQVAAGDYSFLFQTSTSTTLPGSFHYQFGTYQAHIKYTLKGYVNSATAIVKKQKVEVGVTRLMTEVIVSLQETVSAQVSTMCCLRKGVVSLGVNINKSAYVPGETCTLTLELDNSKSLLDVLGFKATLYRTIRLRSDDGSSTIIKLALNEVSVHKRFAASQVFSGNTAIYMALMVQDFTESVQYANTVRWSRIECIYTVVVTAKMDGYRICCGQIPEITREITVYPMQRPLR